jgi:hypothetical protein
MYKNISLDNIRTKKKIKKKEKKRNNFGDVFLNMLLNILKTPKDLQLSK